MLLYFVILIKMHVKELLMFLKNQLLMLVTVQANIQRKRFWIFIQFVK
eukprot:gene29641-36377_t